MAYPNVEYYLFNSETDFEEYSHLPHEYVETFNNPFKGKQTLVTVMEVDTDIWTLSVGDGHILNYDGLEQFFKDSANTSLYSLLEDYPQNSIGMSPIILRKPKSVCEYALHVVQLGFIDNKSSDIMVDYFYDNVEILKSIKDGEHHYYKGNVLKTIISQLRSNSDFLRVYLILCEVFSVEVIENLIKDLFYFMYSSVTLEKQLVESYKQTRNTNIIGAVLSNKKQSMLMHFDQVRELILGIINDTGIIRIADTYRVDHYIHEYLDSLTHKTVIDNLCDKNSNQYSKSEIVIGLLNSCRTLPKSIEQYLVSFRKFCNEHMIQQRIRHKGYDKLWCI